MKIAWMLFGILFAQIATAKFADQKPEWLAGCVEDAGDQLKVSYEKNTRFKTAVDHRYGPGNFLKFGYKTSATETCQEMVEAMVESFKVQSWKDSPDSATEGCWYANWIHMENQNMKDGSLPEEDRTQFYMKFCKSAPDQKWRAKWHERFKQVRAKEIQKALSSL